MYLVLARMPVACASGEVHVPCIYLHSNRTTSGGVYVPCILLHLDLSNSQSLLYY